MAHGYLGDGYGIHGDFDEDQDDNRERRDWRERSDWRDRDRDRGMMFGERHRDRDRFDEDRWSRERSFSANPDDHYRSWRDRHMSELDRDYADYCREREQSFHRDFDAWLTQRHGNPGPLRTGMTQTGISHEPEGELELTDPAKAGQYEEDPMDTATLGTTSGGGKRR